MSAIELYSLSVCFFFFCPEVFLKTLQLPKDTITVITVDY